MSPLPVDIDDEKIQFDDRWLGREELAQEIRAMLDGGNYNIARHSAALESLNQALTGVETLAFRIDNALADALTTTAAREGRTPGAIIREAVARLLASDDPATRSDGGPSGGARAEVAGAHTPVVLTQAVSVQADADPVPVVADELPQAQVASPVTPPAPVFVAPPATSPSVPMAGPGALRFAGMTPAPSVVVDESLVHEAAARTANTADATPAAAKKESDPLDAVERRWFGG